MKTRGVVALALSFCAAGSGASAAEPPQLPMGKGKEVVEAATKNLDHGHFLPRLGGADKVIEKHLEAAKEGSSFLVIYAPDKLSSDRAMNVIRRVPFEFSHRYHRLAIEELK